ncbi:hypothetical protein CHUAL_011892 [Chamberlinius hualienensis]
MTETKSLWSRPISGLRLRIGGSGNYSNGGGHIRMADSVRSLSTSPTNLAGLNFPMFIGSIVLPPPPPLPTLAPAKHRPTSAFCFVKSVKDIGPLIKVRDLFSSLKIAMFTFCTENCLTLPF